MEWEGIGGSVSFIIIEGSSSLACHTESPEIELLCWVYG